MKKIEIYSTPVCSYCNLAKDFFKKNNLAYTEYDVAGNIKKRHEMVEKTGQMGVPVIVVDNDKIVVGFDENALRNLLVVK